MFKISSELSGNIVSSLTDIRDYNKIEYILTNYKPDYIFHTAALKHITFVEDEPLEAIKTNFLATVKLCQLCKQLKLKNTVDVLDYMGQNKKNQFSFLNRNPLE